MSTSQSAVMLYGWRVKAGAAHSTCGYACGWQVKLSDPSLTRSIPERLRDEFLDGKRYADLRLLYSALARCPSVRPLQRWIMSKPQSSSSGNN